MNWHVDVLDEIKSIEKGGCLTIENEVLKEIFPCQVSGSNYDNLLENIYAELIDSAYGAWYLNPDYSTQQITIYRCRPLDLNVRVNPERTKHFRKVRHKTGLYYYLKNGKAKPDCLCSQCNDQGSYQLDLKSKLRIVDRNCPWQVEHREITRHSEMVQCDCIFGVAEKFHLLNINFETPF